MRRLRLLAVILLTSPVLSAGLAPVASAQLVHATLQPDASTDLTATLFSMTQDAQPASTAGEVQVRIQLVDHPAYGLVAESVEILGGDVDVGDLGWTLSGPFDALTASLSGGAASLESSLVTTTPTGEHAAELQPSDLRVAISQGELVATGVVVEHAIGVDRFFVGDAWPIDLEQPATLVTIPQPGGQVAVELRIPVAEQVPVDPPFLVTWLLLDGELVLAGTASVAVPASPQPLWLVGALVLATLLALRRGLPRG